MGTPPTPRCRRKTRLIRKPEVLHLVGLKNSSLYKMIAEGRFPAPLHPHGSRSAYWSEDAVSNWVADRLAEAGQEVAV